MSGQQSPDQAELMRLLAQLGPSATPRSPAAELLREERMSARIDEHVRELASRRGRVRKIGAVLLAAAAMVVCFVGLRFFGGRTGQLSIEQEPLRRGESQRNERAASSVAPEAPAAPAARLIAPSARVAADSPGLRPAPSASAALQSTLAKENQLFKDAAEASRAGDLALALQLLDRLLSEHPASPLAQTALVRKFRLLAANGRSEEAKRQAALYLSSYPTGFAVHEAQTLTNGRRPDAEVGEPEPEAP
jgi:hypothetical protein